MKEQPPYPVEPSRAAYPTEQMFLAVGWPQYLKALAEYTAWYEEYASTEAAQQTDTIPLSSIPGMEDVEELVTASHRHENYVQMVRDGEMGRIRHSGPGERNNNSFQAACSLIENANSEWNDYTIAMAQHDYKTACLAIIAPGRDGFTVNEAMSSWKSALRKIGSKGRDNPPSDDHSAITGQTYTIEEFEAAKKEYEQETTEDGSTSTTGALLENSPVQNNTPVNTVIPLDNTPRLDWENVVPPNTFLYEFCSRTRDLPHPQEFNFFNGLTALGLAVGRTIRLQDNPAVLANLYTLFIASTGQGKSRSIAPLRDVTRKVFGDKIKTNRDYASMQSLVSSFIEETEEVTPQGQPYSAYHPVRQLIVLDEMRDLMTQDKNAIAQQKRTALIRLFDSADNYAVPKAMGRPGEWIAKDYFPCVSGNIQRESVRTVFTTKDDESGFMNRFVPVLGTSRLLRDEDIFSYHFDLGHSVTFLMSIKSYYQDLVEAGTAGWPEQYDVYNYERAPYVALSFANDQLKSEVARYIRTEIVPYKELRTAGGSQMTGRLDLMFKKYMLLSAINSEHGCIESSDFEFAKNLLPYIKHCIEWVEGNAGVDDLSNLREDIIEAVKTVMTSTSKKFERARKAGGASIRDMKEAKRSLRKPNDKVFSEVIKAMLYTNTLIEMEARKPNGWQKAGRPTIGKRYNLGFE